MKKSFIALAVAAMCAFSFTACDEFEDLGLVGNITLTTTNPVAGIPGLTQAYDAGVTIDFKSAMCNVSIDSVTIDTTDYAGTYHIEAGTVMVGTVQNLVNNDIANLTFPLCGINLRDTVVGDYTISMPINDFTFIDYLDTSNINSIIAAGLTIGEGVGNVFAVAVSDSAYYIGHSGTITITAYGKDLQRVEGNVNVEAIYVTLEQLEYLANLDATGRNQYANTIQNFFPRITFTGQISCTRAKIDTVIDALEESANNTQR